MSSIASPTTTMRWPAIFPSSRSTWSRLSRPSGTGVVIGASGSREPGAGSRMLPRTVAPGERRAQRALDDALKDGRRRRVCRDRRVRLPRVALALAQQRELGRHEEARAGQQRHLQGRLVIVAEVPPGAEKMIERHLEAVLVAVGQVG